MPHIEVLAELISEIHVDQFFPPDSIRKFSFLQRWILFNEANYIIGKVLPDLSSEEEERLCQEVLSSIYPHTVRNLVKIDLPEYKKALKSGIAITAGIGSIAYISTKDPWDYAILFLGYITSEILPSIISSFKEVKFTKGAYKGGRIFISPNIDNIALFRHVFVHELIHYLKAKGYIETHLVAEGYAFLRSLELLPNLEDEWSGKGKELMRENISIEEREAKLEEILKPIQEKHSSFLLQKLFFSS
jgi:hypothetical protein